ncbi:MAG: DinB family protein [Gemmatimonadota bacterium]
MIERPQPTEHVPYFSRYIDLVPEGDILKLLADQQRDTQALLETLSEQQARYRYADGKWSVAEVIGHLADTERVFAYRALRFARGDTTPVPGFDENAYTPAGRFDDRSLGDVAAEFAAVRHASLALLRSLPRGADERVGSADGKPVSVRALAYIIAGHELHHVKLLRTRYGLSA